MAGKATTTPYTTLSVPPLTSSSLVVASQAGSVQPTTDSCPSGSTPVIITTSTTNEETQSNSKSIPKQAAALSSTVLRTGALKTQKGCPNLTGPMTVISGVKTEAIGAPDRNVSIIPKYGVLPVLGKDLELDEVRVYFCVVSFLNFADLPLTCGGREFLGKPNLMLRPN